MTSLSAKPKRNNKKRLVHRESKGEGILRMFNETKATPGTVQGFDKFAKNLTTNDYLELDQGIEVLMNPAAVNFLLYTSAAKKNPEKWAFRWLSQTIPEEIITGAMELGFSKKEAVRGIAEYLLGEIDWQKEIRANLKNKRNWIPMNLKGSSKTIKNLVFSSTTEKVAFDRLIHEYNSNPTIKGLIFNKKLSELRSKLPDLVTTWSSEASQPSNKRGKGGRPYHQEDLWAWKQINKNKRSKTSVYPQWLRRVETRKLEDPKRQFNRIASYEWGKDKIGK